VFGISMCVLLFFLLWPLYYMSFFELRLLITVKVLIFAASNFHGFSQLDKFAGIFFRVFLIAQKQTKMYFSVNQFISRRRFIPTR